MKKIYTLLAAMAVTSASFGQAIDNPGMETWRANTSGTAPVVTIAAPHYWYGLDSLVVAAGQLFGTIIGAGTDWKQQLFQENTLVNAGAASAKLVTVEQDVLGFVPGMLSNAEPVFNAGVIAGGGDPVDAISFTGGTPTTLRINTVSAWVAYFAGKDETSGAMGGPDEGVLNVQAVATVDGADSVIGTGMVNIAPSATFVQVTANVTYITTAYNVHTVRFVFASGGGLGTALDSSQLYVDEVTMTGDPQAVGDVSATGSIINVYPNPANGTIYMNGPVNGGFTSTLANVTGKVCATQSLKGTDKIDVSALPTGIYFYTITDKAGLPVQRGKINIKN